MIFTPPDGRSSQFAFSSSRRLSSSSSPSHLSRHCTTSSSASRTLCSPWFLAVSAASWERSSSCCSDLSDVACVAERYHQPSTHKLADRLLPLPKPSMAYPFGLPSGRMHRPQHSPPSTPSPPPPALSPSPSPPTHSSSPHLSPPPPGSPSVPNPPRGTRTLP